MANRFYYSLQEALMVLGNFGFRVLVRFSMFPSQNRAHSFCERPIEISHRLQMALGHRALIIVNTPGPSMPE